MRAKVGLICSRLSCRRRVVIAERGPYLQVDWCPVVGRDCGLLQAIGLPNSSLKGQWHSRMLFFARCSGCGGAPSLRFSRRFMSMPMGVCTDYEPGGFPSVGDGERSAPIFLFDSVDSRYLHAARRYRFEDAGGPGFDVERPACANSRIGALVVSVAVV